MLSSCFPQPNHQITKRKKLYEKYRHSERSEPADISECKILRLQKEKSSGSTQESVRFNWLKPRVDDDRQITFRWNKLHLISTRSKIGAQSWSTPWRSVLLNLSGVLVNNSNVFPWEMEVNATIFLKRRFKIFKFSTYACSTCLRLFLIWSFSSEFRYLLEDNANMIINYNSSAL